MPRKLPPPAFGDLLPDRVELSKAASRAWERYVEAERDASTKAQRYLDPPSAPRKDEALPTLADLAAAFRRAAAAEQAHDLACAKARQEA